MSEEVKMIAQFLGLIIGFAILAYTTNRGQAKQGDKAVAAITGTTQQISNNTSAVDGLTNVLREQTSAFKETSSYFIDANTSLRGRNSALESRVDNLEHLIADQKNKADQRIRDLEDNRRGDQQRLTEFSKAVDDLLQEQARREEASHRRDQQIGALTDEIGAVRKLADDTQKDLEQARADLTRTKEELQAALDSALRELGETREALRLAEREIEEIKRQRDEEHTAAVKEKADLIQKLEDKDKELNTLRQRVRDLEAEVQALRAEIATRDSVPPASAAPSQEQPK